MCFLSQVHRELDQHLTTLGIIGLFSRAGTIELRLAQHVPPRDEARHASPQPNPTRLSQPAGIRFTGLATVAAKARRWPQCTKLDPGAALRPQTPQSFDCLDAASPSRIHSSACLRSISRAKGSSARSAAWRQSLAWCSHNSTCDDIGPASCAHLMPARAQVGAVPAGVDRCYQCLFVTRSDECVQVTSIKSSS